MRTTSDEAMPPARAPWVPAALLGCTVVLALATLPLLRAGAGRTTPGDSFGLTGWGGLAFLAAAVAYAVVGWLVASRVRGNAVGWLFCVIAVLMSVGTLAFAYADQALYGSPGWLPGGVAAAWLQNLALPPAFGLLGATLAVFPDGRLPSRRWRPTLWIAGVGCAGAVIGYALRPGPLDEPFASVNNPVGLAGGFELMDALSGLGWALMAAAVALAALALRWRYARAGRVQREQIRWILLTAVVAGIAMVANLVSWYVPVGEVAQLRMVLLGATFGALPATAGAAILRRRLYDLDVVLNRALVYLSLTTTLAIGYLSGVLLLGLLLRPLTNESDLAVAGSTLAVAAAFRPARRRIQDLVDRRFFRRRYDAALTLSAFSARLRHLHDLEALSGELHRVARDAVQPARSWVWLRGSDAAPGARGGR